MSPIGRAAVTGGTGFIGRALVGRLAADREVAALVRGARAEDPRTRTPGVRRIAGDLDDEQALEALVDGADTVFHCAAFMGKNDPARSWRVNVEGTERLARVAASAGVRRLVYVSSISVFSATERRSGVITEADQPEGLERLNAYARTKYEGELRVRRVGDETGLAWTIVRPTNVYGPGSGPWFWQWERFLRRLRVAPGAIAIDLVHVDDVVTALVAAADAPAAAGRVFHVGHKAIPLREFVAEVGRAIGHEPRSLPIVVDRFARVVADRGYRLLTGRRMSVSLVCPVFYPTEQARAAFGYAPRVTLAEGMAGIASWYSARRVPARGCDNQGTAPRGTAPQVYLSVSGSASAMPGLTQRGTPAGLSAPR